MIELGIGDASDNDTFPSTNWQKAADMGCRFGVVRATTTGAWVAGKPGMREDKQFVPNVNKMRNAGMLDYPYCWFDPRYQLSGFDQAAFYISTITKIGAPGGRLAIVDVEDAAGVALYNATSLLNLKIWCELVSQKWEVAIYSYPSFIDRMATLADISWMRKYDWMVAHWDVTAPRDPYPWHPGAHTIWQYTANMKGTRYGFNPIAPGAAIPKICMAVR
jgi:GH25 family lysozyme M1 (1,4-beta-N-acetylmuramidase)